MQNNSSITYDVIIAGGGMVGMTLAVALAAEGFSVCVIEKTAMPAQLEVDFDGRVSAIALGSRNILQNIGAWEHMEPYAQPIYDIRVSDGNMPFFLHYHYEEVGASPFGYILENRHIRHGLQQVSAHLLNLTIRDKNTIGHVKQYGSHVSVEVGGEHITARLLVAADGKNSYVRNQLGIKSVDWAYQQTAIVCTIAHSLSHDGLAQERFLPAGPFAVLPMTGNHSSLVWVEPKDRVEAYLTLSDEEFAQEITERVGDYLGAITPISKRFSYPLSVMHAHSYISERVALIGDAAHAIHPIAGQGVNLGFRDVAVIAELLADAKNAGQDIGDAAVLKHYQQWRRFDNMTMLAVTDVLTRLFSNNYLATTLARGIGLWAVGKLPSLKRFFMRHAMGLEGDTPKLAQFIKK
ncbi:MAG: UbiH/UbiF/VisC/COQ6 family ubiquinone biosynthesis hydroxylase [Rickettsiales bacterium]|nr:UbiH/UbiF/VisC/COQ6 family ubiquinone biosynthesis hydroxylase [Rickettsiales bacterium]